MSVSYIFLWTAWSLAILALAMSLFTNHRLIRRIRLLERIVDDVTPDCCRVCGCTDDHACLGGCWWVDEGLCSRCAEVSARYSDDGGR